MIRVHLQGGATYDGADLDTIARRVCGPGAFFRQSQNPNDIAAGQFLVPTTFNPHEYWIKAVVMRVEEIHRHA